MKLLLPSLLNGSLEFAFNRLLLQGSERSTLMVLLQGRVLQLTVIDVTTVYLVFAQDRVDILQQYAGTIDSHLSLSLNALGLLKDKGLLMQYIRDGRIDLEGDPQLWQAFSSLVKIPDVDIESLLVPYTGDIMAHLITRQCRKLKSNLDSTAIAMHQQLGDYVREEARLAVGPLELADFADEVGQVNSRLLGLENRLARLIDKARHL